METRAAGTRPCRPLRCAALLLVLAAAVAGSLVGRDSAAPHSDGSTASTKGRAASGGSLGRRSLLTDQCGICPSNDAAISTCATVALSEKRQLLRTAIQFCSDLAFSQASCCVSMPTSNPQLWSLWSACLWWVLALWSQLSGGVILAVSEELEGSLLPRHSAPLHTECGQRRVGQAAWPRIAAVQYAQLICEQQPCWPQPSAAVLVTTPAWWPT